MNPTITDQPTRRHDGQNRYTINFQAHPGREELVLTVLWRAVRHGWEGMPDTKAEILKLLVQTYEYFGESFQALVTTQDEDDVANLGRGKAEALIDQHFPELISRELATVGVHVTRGKQRFEERENQGKLAQTRIGKRLM
jgi:hypothetical protein